MKAVVQDKDSRRTPICQSHSAETLRGGMAIDARWDGDGQLTSLGGMAYFAEYLRTGGFLDKLLHGSPLRYSSPNAPAPADVMGTLLVAVLDGLSRYAGINQLRRDMVCPRLLGFRRMVSEDSVRNGLRQAAANADEWRTWLRGLQDRAVLPLLSEPYAADMDNTVKPTYGHQEGSEKGYNPAKPGRPSHNYQTWAMGATRLILGVGVLPGKRHSGKYGAALAFEWIDQLPSHLRPNLLRGDVGFGSADILEGAESRRIPYLFKMSRTQKMKRHFRALCRHAEWADAGEGWQGLFETMRLAKWPRARRCLFLRRPANRASETGAESDQLLLPTFDEWAMPEDDWREWDFCVLVTSIPDLDAAAVAQLYRDRGNCENVFDELKNQWGWGGFVTRDLARTQLVAGFIAVVYNLWSVFTRLVSPEAHREAVTSRPMLLKVLGRVTTSGRKTVIHLVSNHARAKGIAAALGSIHNFLRQLRANAGKLEPDGLWPAILRAAFRHFLDQKRPLRQYLDGNQWLLPLNLPLP